MRDSKPGRKRRTVGNLRRTREPGPLALIAELKAGSGRQRGLRGRREDRKDLVESGPGGQGRIQRQFEGPMAQGSIKNALDEEFRSVQEANRMAYQEAENAEKQASSEKMWGIVIAVLVVAIFAVGIITTLAGNKGKKK